MDSTTPASPLAGMVLKHLRGMVSALRTQGGTPRLASERALAQQLGVSRRVVRQALAVLEAEGHIQRSPGRGTQLTGPVQPTRDELDDLKQYTSPTELMETRLALEPAIAALAATHASSQDLEAMQNYILKSSRATRPDAWERWDGALHKTIGQSTYNAMLIRFSDMLEKARAQTAWGRLREVSLTGVRQALYTHQHRAIVAAIADRNPEQAAHAMRQHLLTIKRTLIDQLQDAARPDID